MCPGCIYHPPSEWAALLQPEAILAACGEAGYTGWRDRVLTPVTAVQLFLYNLVRMVMWHSATLQHIGVERISFVDALRWLGAPSTGVPWGAFVNPARPHRAAPRVKKRRPKSFPFMVNPRQELCQQLVQQVLGG